MIKYPCPYLNGEVELTGERERHIAERHPDLFLHLRESLASTLAKPDLVRMSSRFGNARLFSRWFEDLHGGKHVVVVVITETDARRHWLVTAYIARRLAGGQQEWPQD